MAYIFQCEGDRLIFTFLIEVWCSPEVSGARPPPCSNFSFTKVGAHHAVLFGGVRGNNDEDLSLIHI